MNANRHSKNRHSLTNDQLLYPNSHLHPQGSVAVYYPKKDFFKMIFGLLALGWMSFLTISEIWSMLLGDVTREMFFSSKIFGILLVGLLSALPIVAFFYVMYGIVAKPLLAKVPILVLTPDGMYHRNSFQSEQEFIAWSEMDTI